jgi:hypothetical protein
MIKQLALFKSRLGYASGWFGLFGTPLLVVNLVQEKLKLININISFIFLFVACVITLFMFGYIAEKIGIIKHEANWSWNQQENMINDLVRK